ncbi:MAG: hypothetical protein LBR50_08320, partial [Tannerella sp.]|nr:hypothetical protein [Tannerella sp.]
MNRTKLSFQAVILMLVCASGLALTSCGKKEQESQHENAQLVKRAFERLNENDTKGLLALVTTDNSDRGDKQVLGGYLWADDIKIEVDDDIYPDEVYYECVIPNPLVAMLNNIYDRVFINHKRSNLSEMFASMSISGFFTIETDPKTGKKQINIDDSNNPFSIYLDIVYNTDLDERYDVNKLTNNENASVIIATVSYTVTSIYSDLVADDYFFDTFIPDMTTFFKDNDLQTLLKVAETMKETKDEIAI